MRTPKAQAAHTLHLGRTHVACWAPYRGPPLLLPCHKRLFPCRRAHARIVAPCRSPPVAIQKLYRDAEAHAACTVPYRSAHTHAVRHVAACLAAPCHNTNFCIATHSYGQAGRVPVPPSRVACRVAASCCARQLDRIASSCPVSQYNLLYRDPNWKMGSSSPSSLLCTLFFFFICSTHCKITIFIFFFISLIEPKIFIIIYFNFFSSCFTHSKTPEKKISPTFFFCLIPPVASLLLLKCSSLDNCNLYNSKILRVKF